ncbi:hypothetical protein BDZ89DRAFT_1126776 [Hymenopellis radicata]|nr:hypothetical protein BDZ89DRAFT_1126776 [Hymenopellis radicata]
MRSNCMSAITRLSLDSVPLAASPDRTLHSILSQTHNLTFLDLTVYIQEIEPDDETDDSDQEQIVAIVKSLEVVPTETVTFLPLLSSLDIRVYDHQDSSNLLYFASVGRFASMLKARWKGEGLARLRRCHFVVHAWRMHRVVYRDDDVSSGVGSGVANVFDEKERCIFHALIDDGMDLSIRVMSDSTEHVGGHPVFAVPS